MWLCASLAMPVTLAASPALAQRPPNAARRAEAGQHFRAGVAAYTRAEYTVALEEFQSAYRIAPHPSVRVNIANCFAQLRQPVEALTHFEQFLVEAPQVPPAQRTEIERQIAELRQQIAEVRVEVTPASARDAIVSIDGRATAIGNVVRMRPGSHVIEVSADGFTPQRLELDVTAGARREVRLELRATAAATVAEAAPAPAASESTPARPAAATVASITPAPAAAEAAPAAPPAPRVARASAPPPPLPEHPRDDGRARGLHPAFFYSGVAVTAAGLIAWGVFGGLAWSENGVFEDAAARIQRGEGDYNRLYDRGYFAALNARNYALASDVALGVTAAAAVTTVVLFLNTRFDRPAVTASPIVGAGGTGLALEGRF
jgi:hypothetical protein